MGQNGKVISILVRQDNLTKIVGHITFDKVLLRLWDLGGQENLRTLWDSYYTESHGVIFVVDSTDRERLEECETTLGKLTNELLKFRSNLTIV